MFKLILILEPLPEQLVLLLYEPASRIHILILYIGSSQRIQIPKIRLPKLPGATRPRIEILRVRQRLSLTLIPPRIYNSYLMIRNFVL